MQYNKLRKLTPGKYRVKISVDSKKGFMNYGEAFIKGSSKKEIIFTTYICHPQMANNELSGPTLAIYLSKFLQNKKRRSYR